MAKEWNSLLNLIENNPLFEEQSSLLRDLQNRIKRNELKISVLGQFKRGKSSLINAMLGEELLPVGIVPLTSVVTEIRYASSFKGEVIFMDGTVKSVSAKELEPYCSEQENSGNYKKVEAIRLWTPCHPFGEEIVLVDTPGVGSVYQNNTDTTYDHIIHSDAILFLLSVDSPVSQTEKDFLLKVREYAPKFFFAVNKADTVEGEDLEKFLAFCEKVAGECMESSVVMHPVSAKTGTGVKELSEKLRESLTSSHDELLNESVEKKLEIILRQIEAKIEFAEKTSALPAEEIAGKLKQLEIKGAELDSFADELEVLARHHTGKLIAPVREALEKEAELLRKRTIVKCSELNAKLSDFRNEIYRPRFQQELDGFLTSELEEMNRKGIALITEGYEKVSGMLAGKAVETGQFLSDFMKREFNVDYPVIEKNFEVSSRSDFILQVGLRPLPKIFMEVVDYILPRKLQDKRFVHECIKKADEDIDCNLNKMIYNYKYKMQESLRTLCRELSEEVTKISKEFTPLIELLTERKNDASDRYSAEAEVYRKIRGELEKLL